MKNILVNNIMGVCIANNDCDTNHELKKECNYCQKDVHCTSDKVEKSTKCIAKYKSAMNEGFSNTKRYNIFYSATGNYIDNSKSGGSLCEEALSNWLHQEEKVINGITIKEGPVYKYNELVKEYGVPDVLANQPRGICIWYIDQNDRIHHSIELKDEYVPHCVPASHNDFLYSYIKVYIPPEKIKDVLAVSGSVGYDGLKKLLYARCASIEANMATFSAVFSVLNSKDPKYSSKIKNRYGTFDENKKFVESELKKNQNKYKRKLNVAYYDLAFPNGCPN